MMSPQQNLSSLSQPLLQQTHSGADVKPFSIRQYVLGCRHRNIYHSWPFHEKHLEFCLNQGEKEVLPPFGCQTPPADPLKGCFNLMLMHDDNNKEARVSRVNDEEEENQHNCSNISANLSEPADTSNLPNSMHVGNSSPLLPPSKTVKDRRNKRRRGRCKKRSMLDILAVAPHSTLEEIHRLNKFYNAYGNISKSELACRKASSEDPVDLPPKGPLLLKFKLNGYNNVNRSML